MTKDIINGTGCSSFGTHIEGVDLGLVGPVSGKCDLVEYNITCQEHENAERQHYRSQHWVPCHILIMSGYA